MTRLLPHPVLTVALVAMWLLLTGASPGHLVLGTIIGVIAGLAFARIEPDAPRIRAWRPLLRLMAIVSVDIVRSNWTVARLMLAGGARHSGFVEVPLRLRDPVPLALLAMILTATPGSAWLEYDPESGILLIHVFDVADPEEWRSLIRDHYETLLMEAFG